VRVLWWQTTARSESDRMIFAILTDHIATAARFECEHTCWDPKDGELCLSSLKPWETMVEEQRVSDVQIDPQT
jgi:hypothetical protein